MIYNQSPSIPYPTNPKRVGWGDLKKARMLLRMQKPRKQLCWGLAELLPSSSSTPQSSVGNLCLVFRYQALLRLLTCCPAGPTSPPHPQEGEKEQQQIYSRFITPSATDYLMLTRSTPSVLQAMSYKGQQQWTTSVLHKLGYSLLIKADHISFKSF